jgi:hypothetical protein
MLNREFLFYSISKNPEEKGGHKIRGTKIGSDFFWLFIKRRGRLASSLLNCKQKKYGPDPKKYQIDLIN